MKWPCLILCLFVAAGSFQAQERLKIGDEAPAFNLVGSDGKTHALKDHLGKRAIVIAWFPKAFTSG